MDDNQYTIVCNRCGKNIITFGGKTLVETTIDIAVSHAKECGGARV